MPDSLIRQPLAITGMACRLPKADDLDSFWQLLFQGTNAVQEIPHDRLDQSLYFDSNKGVRGKTYSKMGGMIPTRRLDTTLLPTYKENAEKFDESHWIFAEVAARAWKHSGHSIDRQRKEVGVYIGHSGGSRRPGDLIYATLAEQTADLLRDLPQFRAMDPAKQLRVIHQLTHRMRKGRPTRGLEASPFLEASAAARLVAETLSLTGPQVVLDAACASSLAALGLAALALQSGDVDAAIVGGASYNKCDSLVLFSQAQSCSATGSRPFDDQADGLISSEGYIAIVLKTLEKATADGDRIWGVIRGLGISTDGRGKSLWAPRREGQLLAVQRAYHGDVRPEHVQYVEAHATSTQIGDATETQALSDFYRHAKIDQQIPVGSVKSNIGHTLETAGLAGLLKTVLSMEHGYIPATIHLNKLNHSIPWSELPFYVPTTNLPWMQPEGRPRCGAVNAFGIGGLNVHVVVEQFDPLYHQALISRTNSPAVRSIKSVSDKGTKSIEPIAIIGRGVIVPGANGIAEFRSLLHSKVSQLREPPKDRWRGRIGIRQGGTPPWEIPTARGGYLVDYAYDWRKHKVPPKQVSRANPLQFMLLDAAGQAIDEAGGATEKLNGLRTSVLVGTVFGGEFGHQLQMGLRLVELRRDLSQSLKFESVPDEEQATILKAFEELFLQAHPALLDETGSFTSSTLASRITKQYNLMGGAMAIDAGDCSSAAALTAAVGLLQSGSSDTVICAAAQRALDLPAYETLTSKGWFGDPTTFDRFPGEGVVVLVLKRLEDAKRDGNKIYAILDQVASANASDGESTPVSSSALTKCIGDLQGADGLLAVLEATIDCEKDNAIVSKQLSIKTSGNQICRLRIRSKEAIINSNFNVAETPSSHLANQNVLQTKTKRIQPNENSGAMQVKVRSGNSIGAGSRSTVVLFPGQGSFTPSVLESWLEASFTGRSTLLEANAILEALGSDSFQELAKANQKADSITSWNVQACTLVANVVMWNVFKETGIDVHAVTGHSLGELAALVATESWDLEQALTFLRERASAVDRSQEAPGSLLSIKADLLTVTDLLNVAPYPVFVTHINAPNQTVVGGQTSHLRDLQSVLTTKRIQSSILAVPAPFHTPLLAKASVELSAVITRFSFLPPKIPFLSGVSNRFEAEPAALQRILVNQLVTPVDFNSVVNRLYDQGARVFIEVGPGEVLKRLTTQVLSGRSATLLSMGDFAGKKDLSTQLHSVMDGAVAGKVAPSKTDVPQSDIQTRTLDATTLRRNRKREMARNHSHASHSTVVSNGLLSAEISHRENFPTDLQKSSPRQTSTPSVESANPASSTPPGSEHYPAALETFLRDFIVEQTGYPHDMVQLDWDLEADLGIDSIKQAQLFGELREMFDVDPSILVAENVRTLRQMLDVLNRSGGKREWLDDFTDHNRSTEESIVIRAVPPAQRPLHTLDDSIAPAIPETKETTEDLAGFMVDFVMEQTGYPPEIIDMDADFEADLGLDSIKMTQLFGELRGHFGYEFENEDRDLLSRCRTLNEILKLLSDRSPVEGRMDASKKKSTFDEFSPKGSQLARSLSKTNGQPDIGDSTRKFASASNVPTVVPTAPIASTVRRAKNGRNLHARSSFQDSLELAFTKGEQYAASICEQLMEESSAPCSSSVLKRLDAVDLNESTLRLLHSISEGAGVHFENIVGLHLRTRLGDPLAPLFQECIGPVSEKMDCDCEVSGLSDATCLCNEDERVTKRFVLRTVPSPIVNCSQSGPHWNGPATVFGSNAVADLLVSTLKRAGLEVLQLASETEPAKLLEQFNHFANGAPVPHLFLTHVFDENAETQLSLSKWKDRREKVVMSAFWLCQRWSQRNIAANLFEDASLVGFVGLGGNFGFQGNIQSAEGGMIAGLMKAIAIESWVNGYRGLPVKIIDVADTDSPQLAVDAALFELANPSYAMEISWADGERKTVRPFAKRVAPGESQAVSRGGNWICTGGARGITSMAAKAIAKKYDLTLHLLGTAPSPRIPESWRGLDREGTRELKNEVMKQARQRGLNSVKAWQDAEKQIEIDATLLMLKDEGIRAQYYCCDVSESGPLKHCLSQIRANFGDIHGVLHGAGVGQDSRFDRKRPEKVEQCLNAKVDGAINLMEATQEDPLELFIGFGSISGRFGANGHTDYSMANDALAKLIDWYREQRPEVRSFTFHWHAWGDVGMATKPETKLALEMIDMQFMPAVEGIEHLLGEIEGNADESEVLITDDRYYRMFYPAESTMHPAERSDARRHRFALLSDQPSPTVNGKLSHVCRLDPAKEIFLREHRLQGNPLLPFVVSMEFLVEAAASHQEQVGIRSRRLPLLIENFEVVRGLKFLDDKPQEVQVESRNHNGKVECRLLCDFYARNGNRIDPGREYAHGKVSQDAEGRLFDWLFPVESHLKFQTATYPDEKQPLYVGPAFRVLKKVSIQEDRVIGKIIAPSLIELSGHHRLAEGWHLPSVILDSCLFATGSFTWNRIRPGVSLPIGMERIRIVSLPSPGEPCLVESRFVRSEGKNAWFDFCLWGRGGVLLVEVAGYKTAWLE